MATKKAKDTHESALQKGSDLFIDYCCSVCEENDTLTEAQVYCESCSKWYCDQCVALHGQMYRKHTTLGRSEITKWPVAKGVAELLTQCDEHKGKQIEMFCEDHSQLCCATCLLLDHRPCKKVTPLTNVEYKKQYEDLQKLITDVTDLSHRLRKLIEQRECSIISLQCALEKILEEIALMRQKFNAALDSLEQRTTNEGRALVSRLQESLQADIDSGKTALHRIQSFQEAADQIGGNDSELSTLAFMKIKKQLSISDSLLSMTTMKSDITLSFTPNKEIEQGFARITTFGNIVCNSSNTSKIIATKQKSHYNVKLSSESLCDIRGVCEFSNGIIILADNINKNVKLLDKQYRVICHCVMPAGPADMCPISDNEVAVAVCDRATINQIHFLAVTNTDLVKKEKINLTHPCTGIFHYNGQLYVTSGEALYRYTLTGTLLDKMYEDTSKPAAVYRCAVNACGDRIYVVNHSNHEVLTLNMSGQLLASFTDPEVKCPVYVHVSESGQVLVCGFISKNIIQLNSDGTEKIATVALLEGEKNLTSIWSSRRTGSILVGQNNSDAIIVFDTK